MERDRPGLACGKAKTMEVVRLTSQRGEEQAIDPPGGVPMPPSMAGLEVHQPLSLHNGLRILVDYGVITRLPMAE